MDVVVLGGLNQDISLKVRSLPLPGETVLAQGIRQGPGGKGLNQAVAARRAGAETIMIGSIGEDQAGSELCAFLANEGIDTGGIVRFAALTTGFASVMIDDLGENAIIVAPGANSAVDDAAVTKAFPPVTKVALCQLEVPLAAVARFLGLARDSGALTILNAAPFVDGARDLFGLCDIVIVNETELAAYAGLAKCADLSGERIVCLARELVSRSGQALVVTLGGRGLVRVTRDDAHWHHAQPAAAVDTTGAGDCLCGVLATGLAEGESIAAATHRAITAAALCVSRFGAAQAMPQRAEFVAC